MKQEIIDKIDSLFLMYEMINQEDSKFGNLIINKLNKLLDNCDHEYADNSSALINPNLHFKSIDKDSPLYYGDEYKRCSICFKLLYFT